MIPYKCLVAVFRTMYEEHWSYEWGAARKGCVDCSGAFVYAYKALGGPKIEHSSNWIARKAVGPFTDPQPGYAAFKWRSDSAGKTPARWKDGKGDYYHVGLVDDSGMYVLNAKGTKSGFSRDPAKGWHSFAPLLAVRYEEETMTTPYDAIVSTQSGTLNMRSGPGKEYPVIFKLPKGTPVTVLVEYDSGWAFIDEDGTQGYVSLSYLTPKQADEKSRWLVTVEFATKDEAEAFANLLKSAKVVEERV